MKVVRIYCSGGGAGNRTTSEEWRIGGNGRDSRGIDGARGEDCAHLAVKLASAVLSREDVRLAFEVLAGGPFCHARATELASLVLEREDVAVEQVTEQVRGGA